MPQKIKSLNNILVVRNDRFGEFLLIIPALRALKESYPEARITAVIDPQLKDLAQSIETIENLLFWPATKHSPVQKIRLLRTLKKARFDAVIMFNPSKEFNFFTFFSGVPIRVGYDRKAGALLTHKIKDLKHLGFKHEIDYNLELVSLIGAVTDNRRLSLNLKHCVPGVATDIIIHPWTSDPVKQWPIENFVALAKRIAVELSRDVIIIGGPQESEMSNWYFNGLAPNIKNFTGKTTLPELGCLLSQARLLISGDSGPVHLAGCVNLPVLALFRNDIPGKGPNRWGPVGNNSRVIAKSKLEDISVDEVF
ncbi:MAG: glycosyltransferase family 9 protein, partial [Candidatus Omnitrophica bacterium]|nr:glycosyltransferase family 9 protein [Candidatus Omnitrophota bacterium]